MKPFLSAFFLRNILSALLFLGVLLFSSCSPKKIVILDPQIQQLHGRWDFTTRAFFRGAQVYVLEDYSQWQQFLAEDGQQFQALPWIISSYFWEHRTQVDRPEQGPVIWVGGNPQSAYYVSHSDWGLLSHTDRNSILDLWSQSDKELLIMAEEDSLSVQRLDTVKQWLDATDISYREIHVTENTWRADLGLVDKESIQDIFLICPVNFSEIISYTENWGCSYSGELYSPDARNLFWNFLLIEPWDAMLMEPLKGSFEANIAVPPRLVINPS